MTHDLEVLTETCVSELRRVKKKQVPATIRRNNSKRVLELVFIRTIGLGGEKE